MSPVGNNYFIFNHEKILKKLCGYELPLRIDSQTNHLRINFTTDATINGKGFKLKWKAGIWFINILINILNKLK